MIARAPRASAVSIAGLDPSGGAGLAADLRAFAAAGVWGGAVCAALTVQSTRGVVRVKAVAAPLVVAQAEALFEDLDVGAVKVGALGSTANVRAVTKLARARDGVPFVVDPVGAPSRGPAASRLDGGARIAALLGLARASTLVTPNLAEAAALLGVEAITARDAADAARALVDLGVQAALVKGGHARGAESIDWFATRAGVHRVATPRRPRLDVHGTGCALSALVAGHLASRRDREPDDAALLAAVRWARARLDAALATPLSVGGGMQVIDVDARERGS
ncbi:MAG TPA: hydroxymethylpyrimidine/phosphomethylpyrimidine kinase [Byssovorax sp.]|jgi:hydroxymethylpyrimidine/phosphomethylpyrimidine kinase